MLFKYGLDVVQVVLGVVSLEKYESLQVFDYFLCLI